MHAAVPGATATEPIAHGSHALSAAYVPAAHGSQLAALGSDTWPGPHGACAVLPSGHAKPAAQPTLVAGVAQYVVAGHGASFALPSGQYELDPHSSFVAGVAQ